MVIAGWVDLSDRTEREARYSRSTVSCECSLVVRITHCCIPLYMVSYVTVYDYSWSDEKFSGDGYNLVT